MNTYTQRFNLLIKRKLLTAMLSSALFAFVISLTDWTIWLGAFYFVLLFVATYGITTSIISDVISQKMTASPNHRYIISFILHCVFGCIFFPFSLMAAIPFFLIDRFLLKFTLSWRILGPLVAIVLLGWIVFFAIN